MTEYFEQFSCSEALIGARMAKEAWLCPLWKKTICTIIIPSILVIAPYFDSARYFSLALVKGNDSGGSGKQRNEAEGRKRMLLRVWGPSLTSCYFCSCGRCCIEKPCTDFGCTTTKLLHKGQAVVQYASIVHGRCLVLLPLPPLQLAT